LSNPYIHEAYEEEIREIMATISQGEASWAFISIDGRKPVRYPYESPAFFV
jgi:hypothetical protein